jgi:hypothetical protein
MRKLTQKEFLEKAKSIHGDDFDYTKVEYINSKKKVIIICKKFGHGEFLQKPNIHLHGSGCSKCANKNVTTEEFIRKAKEVHGDAYDYSLVEYVNNTTKIKIKCLEGHIFTQIPQSHLSGHGCPICGGNKKITTEEFITRAKNVYGDKFDLSQTKYVNSDTKVNIICSKHGEIFIYPLDFLKGNGCPKCNLEKIGDSKRSNTQEFIEKAINIHGNEYDYSKVDYINSKTNVCIICSQGHEFFQKPNKHLNGDGCSKCNGKYIITKEEFIEQANKKHNNKFDYSKIEYLNKKTKIVIICPLHGEFTQSPANHLKGCTCPNCNKDKRSKHDEIYYIEKECPICGKVFKSKKKEKLKYCSYKCAGEGKRKKAMKKHMESFNKLGYELLEYNKNGILIIKHPDGHIFENTKSLILGRLYKGIELSTVLLPKYKLRSSLEIKICKFLDEIGIEYKKNRRNIIKGFEIDIFIKKYNLGIETNGIYWHSEFFLKKDYHLNKLNLCLDQNYTLFQFFEDEIIKNFDIVKLMISNRLNIFKETIYGNDCQINEIKSNIILKEFLEKNHILGNVLNTINIGLEIKNELVSVICLKQYKNNSNKFEIVRICNKLNTNIINGENVLLDYFINNYQSNKIIIYLDRRYSNEILFENLGFVKTKVITPNFWYARHKHRKFSYEYNKKDLILTESDINKTKHELLIERKFPRIYDCGLLKFELDVIKQKTTN